MDQPPPPQPPLGPPPASVPSSETAPPSEPPARPRRRIKPAIVIVAIVALIVVTAGAAVALFFVRGSGDTVITMVPDNVSAYSSVYLDPPGSQKIALNGIFQKTGFGDVSARDAKINMWLDSALKDTGLTHDDVRPWVGNQVAMLVRASGQSAPLGAVLIASKDDGKAQAALDRARTSPSGSKSGWTSASRDGVNYWKTNDATGGAYAVVDHVAVLATSEAILGDIIDTDHGKHAPLSGNAQYKRVLADLPSDNVMVGYLDVHGLVAQYGSLLGSVAGSAKCVTDALSSQFGAYLGAGMAVTAQSDGIQLDTTLDYDQSALSADQKQALSQNSARDNTTLAFIPPNAYGFISIAELGPAVQQALKQFSCALGAGNVADQLGLTDPHGVLSHIHDASVEVEGNIRAPGGALILATDDEKNTRQFLDQLATLAAGQMASQTTSDNGVPTTADQTAPPTAVQSTTYKGFTITLLANPTGGSLPVSPAYTVGKGVAIIGSSPASVKAAIDAQAGDNVAGSDPYKVVVAHLAQKSASQVYLDVARIVATARDLIPADQQQGYETNVAPIVDHLGPVIVGGNNSSDHSSGRVFFTIK